MIYNNVIKAKFIERPNRFVAIVEIDNQNVVVHVKNTGRCKELLIAGVTVYLAKAENPNRKTPYDLIAVEKVINSGETILINIDSQIPNYVAEEWLKSQKLFSELAIIKREVTHGKSRFDFYIEDGLRKIFLEVKGVTLENNGIAMFPDAPTQRGVKHIDELINCIDEGFESYILFVVQMKPIKEFRPNDCMHKEFGNALRLASRKGVNILAVDCIIQYNSIKIDNYIPINLEKYSII